VGKITIIKALFELKTNENLSFYLGGQTHTDTRPKNLAIDPFAPQMLHIDAKNYSFYPIHLVTLAVSFKNRILEITNVSSN